MSSLLDGVNEVLKRAGELDNDTGALTTLTDSARQWNIDITVQIWNELVDELYARLGIMVPLNTDESTTITLVASQRAYALPSDLVQIQWPLVDETNGRIIAEYPGGYEDLIEDQLIPGNYKGVPLAAVIRPSDGYLYIDTNPTSSEAGLAYKLRYLKDVSVSSAADTFPFNDAVFRALVPAATELFRYNKTQEMSGSIFRNAFGRAARLMSRQPAPTSWAPMMERKNRYSGTDPLES